MGVPSVLRRYGDELLAVALAVGFVTELLVGGYATEAPGSVPLALVATLPVAYRRRLPLASFLVTWSGVLALGTVISGDLGQDFATFLVLFFVSVYSVGAHTSGREAWATACLVPVGVALFVANDGDPFHAADVAFGTALVAGPWAAGLAIRLRRERESTLAAQTRELEETQEERARLAVAEERARIARELHDVVSHAISVTVLQARGGRRMLGVDVAEARRAFDAIEQTNAQALGDMRRLLALLRETDEEQRHTPQPSLARLDELAAEVRASGLTVDVEVTGNGVRPPPGVDLTAYRIVQEALTNVLKHAGAERARVSVRYGVDAVEIAVLDDGRGRTAAPSAERQGDGQGHIGIRERVAVVGGHSDIGPDPGGGFHVRARLPYAVEP